MKSVQHQQYGFFQSLFDFTFHHYVTTKLVRVVYAIGIVAIALAVLVVAISGFVGPDRNPVQGIALLVLSPLIFLVVVIALRIQLELVIAVIQIAENTLPPDQT